MVRRNVRNPTIETMPRELDSRSNDGIRVQLLWHPRDNRVAVAVEDIKTGDAFEIAVAPRQRPLDVFHHPYAYAAETLALAPKQGARCQLPT
jgi:hypothetical protein